LKLLLGHVIKKKKGDEMLYLNIQLTILVHMETGERGVRKRERGKDERVYM
jgi:hypothetical protein